MGYPVLDREIQRERLAFGKVIPRDIASSSPLRRLRGHQEISTNTIGFILSQCCVWYCGPLGTSRTVKYIIWLLWCPALLSKIIHSLSHDGYYQLRQLSTVARSPTPTATLVHTFFASRHDEKTEYCSCLYAGLPSCPAKLPGSRSTIWSPSYWSHT